MRTSKPRIVENLPFKDYRLQANSDVPLFSKSVASQIIEKNAYDAWYFHPKLGKHSKKQTSAMRDGSILHALLLDGKNEVVFLDYPDFKTGDAQAQRDAVIDSGRIAVSKNEKKKFSEAHTAISRQIRNLLPVFYEAPHMKELSIYYDYFNGVKCQSRFDWISPEYGLIIDPKKTTDASTDACEKQIGSFNYDIQAHLYLYAANLMWPGIEWKFLFLFFEDKQPYHVNIGPVTEFAMHTGERKTHIASEQWLVSLEKGTEFEHWPGYGYNETGFDIPAWEYKKYMEA